ncbi:hypothetical protein ACTNC4_03975 [Collinsella sp. HCP3S3_B8]|uniref:hypothetical protein n=1 Tax=Collinsella sp. HCP3S3_B8 TaxID=3438933 RepID=UPI003F8969E7
MGHQVVLALDALEDGRDNKRRYRRQERRSRGDAGAPGALHPVKRRRQYQCERHRQPQHPRSHALAISFDCLFHNGYVSLHERVYGGAE